MRSTPTATSHCDACRDLIDAARRLGVTFHRAFDLARDPYRALEEIVALGCERVLTSGQRATAIEGAALIRDLVAAAGERITVMPGAGVDADNIARLRTATGAHEFHASAKRSLASAMRYKPDRLVDMQTGEMRSDVAAIRRLRYALDLTP